jgi:hypothetical protein
MTDGNGVVHVHGVDASSGRVTWSTLCGQTDLPPGWWGNPKPTCERCLALQREGG